MVAFDSGCPRAPQAVIQPDIDVLLLGTRTHLEECVGFIAECTTADAAPSPDQPRAVFHYKGGLQAWLAKGFEAPLEPLLAIIDPHIHLFPAGGGKKAWVPGQQISDSAANAFGERSALGQPYDYAQFDAVARQNNVIGSVFIECNQFYKKLKDAGANTNSVAHMETAGLAVVAAAASRPLAIVGHVDLREGPDAVQQALSNHLSAGLVNGVQRFVGIRHVLAWDDNRMLQGLVRNGFTNSSDPQFRAAVAVLGERGLTFDTWGFHTNLLDIAELARAVPETTIVLNHAGIPLGIGPKYRRDNTSTTAGGDGGPTTATEATWRQGIAELAKCPNVVVKLSGLTMPLCGFGWERCERPPSSTELAEKLAPFYHFVIEKFGPSRCMFASNFPPDRASAPYTVLWNAFKRIAADMRASDEEMVMLFRGTAQRIYGTGLK